MNAPKPAEGRIYVVRDRASGDVLALVRAITKDGALAHYVSDSLSVALPTQEELLELGASTPPIRRLDATAYRRTEGDAAGVRG